MLETVTKKDTGGRLSNELGPLPGREQDKAATTKDTEMVIARGSAMETLTRATTAKNGGGLQVKKINCSANDASPKVRRDIRTQEKGTSCLQDVVMLAFSYPVLGVSPRTR